MVKSISDGTDSGVAYTTGQSSSDVFQRLFLKGAEHEHVDSEELAEFEQMLSQAVTDANLVKQFQ